MRSDILAVLALVGLVVCATVHAGSLEADAKDLDAVMGALRAAGATDRPLLHRTGEGFIRYVGAPPGGYFAVDTATKSATPEASAQSFLDTHRKAFGLVSDRTRLRSSRTMALGDRAVVRMDQTYRGLRVFGAEMVVQVGGAGDVLSVASDVARDLRGLDEGAVSLLPRVDATAAAAKAKSAVAGRSDHLSSEDIRITQGPELMVYQPEVLGLAGATRLVWWMEAAGSKMPPVMEAVLIDAQSGQEALHFSLIHEGKRRIITDLNNSLSVPPTPARVEAQGPTGIPDVDDAYDYLGDVYDFFLTHHGWDNFDNGQAPPPSGFPFMPIFAYVRLPEMNAFFVPAGSLLLPGAVTPSLFFGTDWAVDDIAAHEFTHGVTAYTSRLIYRGFSGAINESFSDIWGEFVDLTNGRGNDSDEVRWLVSEDLPADMLELIMPGAPVPGIRSMKDPTVFGDPDRLGSPLVVPPDSFFDNGGVHINSGIGNKLCYLLTDGDEFNGRKVEGFGIDTVADLFWECQMTLPMAADYHDLYFALMQGATNLNLSFDERLNVLTASLAVEIVPPGEFAAFQATATRTFDGAAAISLYWEVPNPDEVVNTFLVRSTAGYTTQSSEGTVIDPGIENKHLDLDVIEGIEYFYTLVQDHRDGTVTLAFANAVAGAPPLNYLTEAFDASHPIDLSNTQLLFTPVGGPVSEIATGARTGYERYEVTRVRDVRSLPVPRSDSQGAGHSLTFLEDGYVYYYGFSQPIFFFGEYYPIIYLYENGNIAFAPIASGSFDNFPSLAAHFSVPRISFLFADLNTRSGGSVWGRRLDDRLVITFEQVPERVLRAFPAPDPNTVQVELFDNGQIRFTYLQVLVENAVVGLSNGQGVPVDPADLFDNVAGTVALSDLSNAPLTAARLRLEPIGTQEVEAGARVAFTARATGPAGAPTPQFAAAWALETPVPFVDNGDGTARFDWQTTLTDAGRYTVRITAVAGAQTAFQDVLISVGDVFVEPVATNLRLSTGIPLEDPTRNRDIPAGTPLFASYSYSHPQGDPEGPTQLYWYRNSALVPGLTNRTSVPASLVGGGEYWSFSILPISASYVTGRETFSPTVYALAVPEIVAVTPNFGDITGGDRVLIKGARLSAPLLVTFGGVKTDQVFSRGDGEIEVISPLRVAGTVDILVKTPSGSGVLKQAFTYMTNASKVPNPDVNGDGVVDATDLQLVVNAILSQSKTQLNADANRDGVVNALDMQTVVNAALYR